MELIYTEGSGWYLYNTIGIVAGPVAGPGLNVTWYMKVDVATSGGNTTFTASYATVSTGPFARLLSYTSATPTDPVAVGPWLFNPNTASTKTTGQHIGALTVQDIPALTSATIYGPTQQVFSNPAVFTVGLNAPAGLGGVVITMSSSNGSDTFQATQGGTNLSPKQITIPQNSMYGTFWLTPGGATGNRTISISTSPSLTSSPITYNALGTATSFTVTGATGGHQLVPATWMVNLVGGDFIGTVTATPGGGAGQCQIFSPIVVAFTGNGTLSQTLTFTPFVVDSVTFTFTNSGSLTNPAPASYLATGEYLLDAFAGSGLIQAHTSQSLPSGLGGSGYAAPSAGAISLDGSGGVYLSATGAAISLSAAAMPSAVSCEFIFQYKALSAPGGTAIACVVVMASGGNTLAFGLFNSSLCWLLNGAYIISAGSCAPPSPGTPWLIKLDVWVDHSNPGWTDLQSQYSSNGGTSWAPLITNASNYNQQLTTSLPTAIAAGFYFGGPAFASGTGPHLANLTVQDIAPATPNCQISKAYVTTSGQSVAFFFKTISGGAALIPTAMNFAPSFYKNGQSVGVGVNAWVTGQHSSAIVQLQPGTQIGPGDTVTVSTPASWMSCGVTYAANEVTSFALTNYSGMSCFGTDTLAKTFKPGINLSDMGSSSGTKYQIPMNWRYRLLPAEAGSQNTVDGYPTVMFHPTETMSFLDMGSTNVIDSTTFPGVPGMWAIGFDDTYVAKGGSPTTLTIVSSNTAQATVTQISSVNNPGSGGFNQYYMFNVQPASGSTSANLPIALQWTNASSRPYVGNLWIVGPGDFTYTLGTPLTFDRTQPYALSGQFLARLANGCGSMRFMDSITSYGGQSTTSEPWELRNLTDFSWNNSLLTNYNIGYVAARALNLTNSPYVYSEWIGSAYNLALNANVDSVATSFSINAGGDAWAIPIAGLLLTMGTGEQCRIRSVSGTTNPYTCMVERGSSGTTAAGKTAGTITCAGRLNVTSLSQVGTQLVELVTQANHNLKTGLTISFGYGTYPTMSFTDGSTNNLQGTGWILQVTGPKTFVVDMRSSTTSVTLGPTVTSYTLNPASNISPWVQPNVGFPYDFAAITAGHFPGCNIHINLPPIASDSFCYAVANRILNNFPAGRKVYVELGDEWWNGGQSELYIGQTMDRLLGYSPSNGGYKWYVIRTGQIRTIFRTVFGSRASEIYAVINSMAVAPSNGVAMLNLAIANGVTIDAYAVAPYIHPSGIAASITAWNNSATIQQMIDLWVHDLYCKPTGWSSLFASHLANIASYNASTGGHCILVGYEGGYESGAPAGANNLATLSRDLPYDPNWLIIEQDFYALLQASSFVNINLYSYGIYYYSTNNWALYHWPYQPYGKGDGSDGKANNRLCLATPGFTHTKAATTNQDQQNVSVRGQAFLKWMQPAQAKKSMLFVPNRFVHQ